MIIRRITLARLQAPLVTPFKTALRTVDAVHDVVVRIHADDGCIGYGSAPATAVITGDTHGAIIDAIDRHIAPALLGRKVADLHANTARVQAALHGNGSAKAAVDMALHDLWARHHGAPLHVLLGGGPTRLTTDLTISVNPVDAMVADAERALAQGYTALKIKLGAEPALDVERVRAIHHAVGGQAVLRLDANQAWSAKQAIGIMRTLEREGILPDLLEQPVPARDLAGLREVTRRIQTPVLADESVFGPEQALELIRLRAADILNIKLMKTGGITRALQLADIAALHGMPCMMGCMLESPIGVAAAAHVALARSDIVTRIDLDAAALCRHNPVRGGMHFDGPQLTASAQPGLGIEGVDGLLPLGDDSPD